MGGSMQEFHALMREWETFYLLIGTAGATLAGLMFVAITIGERAARRASIPVLRAHSDPALLAFVLCLVLSALFLMPTLNRFWFAALVGASGLLNLLYIAAVLRQLLVEVRVQARWDLSDWTWYAAVPVVSGALLLLAGVLAFLSRSGPALDVIGAGLLLVLAMGIRNAWDLVTFSMVVEQRARETQARGEE